MTDLLSIDTAIAAVLLAVAGAIAGVLSGIFGIGGGIVLVPILVFVFTLQGVPEAYIAHSAVGTSLAIIIPTAIRSFRAHRQKGAGNIELLKSWTLWVPFGVIVASFVVGFVSGQVLKMIFAFVALIIAIKMLFGGEKWRLSDDLPGNTATKGAGFGIGFVSTFMGIGGGNLNNLFMTLFGQSMHQAVSTSAGLGVLIAIPATLGYVISGWGLDGMPPWSLGYVNLLALVMIAPFSMLTAPFGARLAHAMPAKQLEQVFGVFLIAVVISFVW